MEKEQREWWLFAVMAVLIVAVVALAWLDVPSFEPPSVTYQSGEATTETTSDTANGSARLINVNSATAAELMRLNGVGETIAARIIDYRTQHGAFSSVEELLKVNGIGEKRLEQWRPYLTV